MKKILTILIVSTSLLFFTACSSTTQADYDSLLEEIDNLKIENKTLSSQIEELESEKLELVKSATTIISEATQNQIQSLDSEYNEKYIDLITSQIFDKNCDFVITNKAILINTYYDQEYSYELYQKMVSDCNAFSVLYQNTIPSVSEGSLSFDNISMYCWDKNFNRIISILYSQEGTEITLADIMLNLQYTYDIIENYESQAN